MKRFRATISLAALVLAASACGDDITRGDCAAQFAWDGVEYHGLGVPRAQLAVEKIGDGTVRTCAADPAPPTNVYAVEGVDPEVAHRRIVVDALTS